MTDEAFNKLNTPIGSAIARNNWDDSDSSSYEVLLDDLGKPSEETEETEESEESEETGESEESEESEEVIIPKKKPTDRLECPICGKTYTRSNSGHHKKTNYHKMYEKANNKLRKLLL